MALTAKKRKFAEAVRSGMSATRAAITAGYSEKTATQAASRLMKDKDVIAEIGRKEAVNKAKEKAKAEGKPLNLPDLSKLYSDPKDFLLAVMNDGGEEPRYRVDAAKALMPYIHERKGEAGKKAGKEGAAKNAQSTGKFGSILQMRKTG